MPLNRVIGDYVVSKLKEISDKEEANAKPIQSSWQEYAQRPTHQPLREGDNRLKEIRRVFQRIDTPGNVASPQQAEIQEMCIRACARVIYTRQVFEDNQLEIMRRNNWNSRQMEQFILVSAPRRLGKTFALVRTNVALLLAIPNITIVVFATAFDQANKLVEEVNKLFQSHFPHVNVKYARTEGKLRVFFPNKDVRTIIGLSSSVDVSASLLFYARVPTLPFFVSSSSRMNDARKKLTRGLRT